MIELERVRVAFRNSGADRVVFDDANFCFRRAETTAVLGPSGCGKTTLLRLIAGLQKPTAGVVRLADPAARIGMIFQEYTAFPWMTVRENITFGLRQHPMQGRDSSREVAYWLAKTGLTESGSYYPAQLSGGMRQRLAMARTLAVRPQIVLMDEPFGALDEITREQMGTFAKDLLASLELTVVFVTHSIVEALRVASRVVVLSSSPATSVLDVRVTPEETREEAVHQSNGGSPLAARIRHALRPDQLFSAQP